MKINSQESLGFRIVYRDIVLSKKLTVVFRPFDQKYLKLYKKGALVRGVIIAQPGNASFNQKPCITDDEILLRIKSIKPMLISSLKNKDFDGSSPDVYNPPSLAYHLGMVYNRPASKFNKHIKIIKIELEYVRTKKGGKGGNSQCHFE
jgi:hypothetical protein